MPANGSFAASASPATLVLASASPRRQLLLRVAGFAPVVVESDIDDAGVRRGAVSPEAYVMALSWFKATRVAWRIDRGEAPPRGDLAAPVIVAADTVCVHEDELLGKPRDAGHAAEMLRAMRNRAHRVVTGVTIVPPGGRPWRRLVLVDVAMVRLGQLGDDEIDRYVGGEGWRGKAGAYNFSERVDAGWPVECEGDPTGVMGLPMRRVARILDGLGVPRGRGGEG